MHTQYTYSRHDEYKKKTDDRIKYDSGDDPSLEQSNIRNTTRRSQIRPMHSLSLSHTSIQTTASIQRQQRGRTAIITVRTHGMYKTHNDERLFTLKNARVMPLNGNDYYYSSKEKCENSASTARVAYRAPFLDELQ